MKKIKHETKGTNANVSRTAVKSGDFGSYEEGVKRTMKAAAVDGVPYAASVAKSVAPPIHGKTISGKTKMDSPTSRGNTKNK